MKYILSIDQGTSSTRSIIFNEKANIVGLDQLEHEQIYPHPSWVEHNPDEIKANVIQTMRVALEQAKISWDQISAIGIANQRETVVAWDKKTGKVLSNAIVWQCRRTTSAVEQLISKGHKEVFHQKTGLVLDAYFSGTKIKWLLDNVEAVKSCKNLAIGTIDSWIIYFLSGEHRTDASNASRTLLYDITTNSWSDELCDILGIPQHILPQVHTHGGIPFGTYEIDSQSIPITGVLGDQQSALFGQTAFEPGQIKTTYGTGNFTLLNTGNKIHYSHHGLLTTVAWQIGKETIYALEGSVFITGAALSWLRDGLGIFENYREIDKIAKEVKDSDGVYFVPAFVGLGAPYWDPTVRGTILGITGGTTRPHLIHATLDAIALQTQDLLDTMERDTSLHIKEMRVDGGMTKSALLMQKQSDISQLRIRIPQIAETTALGVALMAGLGLVWNNFEEIKQLNPDRIDFVPRRSRAELKTLKLKWIEAVSASRAWKG